MAGTIAAIIAYACFGFAPALAVAIVLGIVGIGLVALWAWLCGGGLSHSGCGTLATVMDWLTGYLVVQGVVTFILWLTGIGDYCSIGLLACCAYIGVVVAVLHWLCRLFKCERC
jgi:hypothetical protein